MYISSASAGRMPLKSKEHQRRKWLRAIKSVEDPTLLVANSRTLVLVLGKAIVTQPTVQAWCITK